MRHRLQALVLKSTIIFESDRLLTLFSNEKGRLNILAKGAAKSQKRFGGRLTLFNEIEADISHKQTLSQLNNCHIIHPFKNISQSYNQLCLAGYCSQIIMLITSQEQVHRDAHS